MAEQLKDFQTATMVRKLTSDLMTPLIRKLEEHIQTVLKEGEHFRRDNAMLQTVMQAQQTVNQQIVKQSQQLRELKLLISTQRDDHTKTKQDQSERSNQLKNQILQLRKELNRTTEKLQQLKQTDGLLSNNLSDIKSNYKRQLQSIQNKINAVYNDTLRQTTNIQSKYDQYAVKLTQLKAFIDLQCQTAVQTQKKVELYLNQRQEISSKMEHLFKHIFGHVSLEQFEKYKKYQSIELRSTLQRLQNMIDSALTPDIRHFLPTVIKQVEQLKKLAGLQENQQKLSKKISIIYAELNESINGVNRKTEDQNQLLDNHKTILDNLQIRTAKNQAEFQNASKSMQQNIQKLAIRIGSEVAKYTQQFKSLMKQIETNLDRKIDTKLNSSQKLKILQDIQNVKKGLQKLMNQKNDSLESSFNQNFNKINYKIQNMFIDKKNQLMKIAREAVPKQQTQFLQRMRTFAPTVDRLRDNMQEKAAKIENIANTLQDTLEKFSNRITKIKSDADLRNQFTVQEIRSLQRNRDETEKKIQKIGKILSTYAQSIIIINAYLVHIQSRKHKSNINGQVFVSFFDGAIYQIKQQIDQDIITYRKKKLNKFDLIRFNLTSLVNNVDNIFNEEFLGWAKWRPSNIFKNNIIAQLELQKSKALHNVEQKQPEHLLLPSANKKQQIKNFNQTMTIQHDPNNNIFSKTADLRKLSKLKNLKLRQMDDRYQDIHPRTRRAGYSRQQRLPPRY